MIKVSRIAKYRKPGLGLIFTAPAAVQVRTAHNVNTRVAGYFYGRIYGVKVSLN